MMESKRVEFQFEVEGMQDLELEEEKSLNATVQEFKEQSKGFCLCDVYKIDPTVMKFVRFKGSS